VGDEIDRAQQRDEFFLNLALGEHARRNPPQPPFYKVGSAPDPEAPNPTLKKGGASETSGGICEDCGDPIPEARLRAMPGATRCVACQTMHENWRPL